MSVYLIWNQSKLGTRLWRLLHQVNKVLFTSNSPSVYMTRQKARNAIARTRRCINKGNNREAWSNNFLITRVKDVI